MASSASSGCVVIWISQFCFVTDPVMCAYWCIWVPHVLKNVRPPHVYTQSGKYFIYVLYLISVHSSVWESLSIDSFSIHVCSASVFVCLFPRKDWSRTDTSTKKENPTHYDIWIYFTARANVCDGVIFDVLVVNESKEGFLTYMLICFGLWCRYLRLHL